MFFINFSSGERWEKAGNLPVEMEFCRVNGTIPNDPFSDRPLRHPIFPYLMVFCKRGGVCKRCATEDTFYSRKCNACERFLDGEP